MDQYLRYVRLKWLIKKTLSGFKQKNNFKYKNIIESYEHGKV